MGEAAARAAPPTGCGPVGAQHVGMCPEAAQRVAEGKKRKDEKDASGPDHIRSFPHSQKTWKTIDWLDGSWSSDFTKTDGQPASSTLLVRTALEWRRKSEGTTVTTVTGTVCSKKCRKKKKHAGHSSPMTCRSVISRASLALSLVLLRAVSPVLAALPSPCVARNYFHCPADIPVFMSASDVM